MDFLAKKASELSLEEAEALKGLFGKNKLDEKGTYLYWAEEGRIALALLYRESGFKSKVYGEGDKALKKAFKEEVENYIASLKKVEEKAPEMVEMPVIDAPIVLRNFQMTRNAVSKGPLDIVLWNGLNKFDDFEGDILGALTYSFSEKTGGEIFYRGTLIKPGETKDEAPYVLTLTVMGIGVIQAVYILRGSIMEREKQAYLLSKPFKALKAFKFRDPVELEKKKEAFMKALTESDPYLVAYDPSSRENRGRNLDRLFENASFPVASCTGTDPEAKKKELEERKAREKRIDSLNLMPILKFLRKHLVFAAMMLASSFLVAFALLLSAFLLGGDSAGVAAVLIVCAIILYPINALLGSSLYSFLLEEKDPKKLAWQNLAVSVFLNVVGALLAYGVIMLIRLTGTDFLSGDIGSTFYICLGVSIAALIASPFFAKPLLPLTRGKKKEEPEQTE